MACRIEYPVSRHSARESALRADLFEMRKAIDHFYADKKRYPNDLRELVTEKYLRTIPKDPITMRSDWIEVGASGERKAVIDVRSAAIGKSSDGTAYRDW